MISFGIHFLICNIFISILIGAILLAKKLAAGYLSGCSQYRVWFLLPVLLAVPFLPLRPTGFLQLLRWFCSIKNSALPESGAAASDISAPLPAADWMNDFSVSVTRASAPAASCIPLLLWTAGMLFMVFFLVKSRIRLYRIEQSALPLQNRNIRTLYRQCRIQLQIKKEIPIYSTAFLKSPIIVGLLRPRIYLPIRLILEFRETDIRYMLLHELQHYKHKDAFLNCLMNLAAIVYWFNPIVWYALKEAKNDREIACDTFVLQMLDAEDYTDYGHTLLNFARSISLFPFSLAAGIGGSKKRIRKRILNIAMYQPKTGRPKIRERFVFSVLIVLILESISLIPVPASDTDAVLPGDAVVHTKDLSDFFTDCEGCFVLYDSNADAWDIYNEALASKRVSPDSTYKIYSALFALEHGLITPKDSTLAWNKNIYSFPEWNTDQSLASAMRNSVNWYFQTLDQRAGFDALERFYQEIGYGNHDLSGGVTDFWLESSLKISALEQVELMKRLYENEFHFREENVQAVKDALMLSSSEQAVLYGKTGTGAIHGESVNGWLVGYVEAVDNTWFFAVNVQGEKEAGSLKASKIARDILDAMQIFSASE